MEMFPHALDVGPDEHQHAVEKFLETIQVAREGRLHPSLITAKQLEQIAREIQDHIPEMEFPVHW